MRCKVSVIVPNYNHAPYLRQRIDSILNQTYQDFELILLDDCSTDNSREILLSYQDNSHVSQIVFNEQNGGSPFKQWNKGIELAKGEWVWIAESDDWADENFLETIMQGARQHPNCGLIYALARYMNDDGEIWRVKESGDAISHSGDDFVKRKLVFSNDIYNVSMALFRKELYQKIDHLLYEDMRLCGDWFFYVQLCQFTNVLEIQKVCSNYRVHGDNTSIGAEYEGLTFLEGIRVLDYMCRVFKIKQDVYARNWGKQWMKYENKYCFSKEVRNKIKERIKCSYTSIYIWYVVYKVYYGLIRRYRIYK